MMRLLSSLADNTWLLLLRGVAAIAFGILAFFWPGLTLLTLTLLWGTYALADGLLALWAAIAAKGDMAPRWWLGLTGATSCRSKGCLASGVGRHRDGAANMPNKSTASNITAPTRLLDGGAAERDGPMDNFIPSENPSGVEQLKRCAVIATQNVARLRQQLENEPDEFTNEAWVGIYSGRPVSSDRARNSRLVDTDSTIEAIGTTAAGAKIQKAWLAVKATGTSCVLVELVLQ